MEVFAGALLILTVVILIVSLSYLIISTKHKERLKLLEKGFDPKDFIINEGPPITLRIGALLLGVGIGFLMAFIFDEFVMPTNENPAIYPAMLLIFGGISQLIIYNTFKSKK